MVHESWTKRMEPFKVAGNLYFVGTKPASSHLIDTGDGLILLDSAYQETLYLVLDGIYRLGFSPYDIRYILHSHGHVDHAGATRALVEMTGAKTIIGRYDADYVSGRRDLTYAKELDMTFEGTFEPDILLNDGDDVTLGNVSIHCLHTPGHTEGTMSYFFDVEEHGRTYRVGTFGGAGMNTLRRSFLEQYGLPLSLRDDFRAALHRAKQEKVDIFIGNHQEQSHTLERYARLQAGQWDAFIDADAWPEYLTGVEGNLDRLLEKEANEK